MGLKEPQLSSEGLHSQEAICTTSSCDIICIKMKVMILSSKNQLVGHILNKIIVI